MLSFWSAESAQSVVSLLDVPIFRLITISAFIRKPIFRTQLVFIVKGLLVESQGPVVQSIVSLMSSLVVKMLTVLVRTISNSQLFLLKKCE